MYGCPELAALELSVPSSDIGDLSTHQKLVPLGFNGVHDQKGLIQPRPPSAGDPIGTDFAFATAPFTKHRSAPVANESSQSTPTCKTPQPDNMAASTATVNEVHTGIERSASLGRALQVSATIGNQKEPKNVSPRSLTSTAQSLDKAEIASNGQCNSVGNVTTATIDQPFVSTLSDCPPIKDIQHFVAHGNSVVDGPQVNGDTAIFPKRKVKVYVPKTAKHTVRKSEKPAVPTTQAAVSTVLSSRKIVTYDSGHQESRPKKASKSACFADKERRQAIEPVAGSASDESKAGGLANNDRAAGTPKLLHTSVVSSNESAPVLPLQEVKSPFEVGQKAVERQLEVASPVPPTTDENAIEDPDQELSSKILHGVSDVGGRSRVKKSAKISKLSREVRSACSTDFEAEGSSASELLRRAVEAVELAEQNKQTAEVEAAQKHAAADDLIKQLEAQLARLADDHGKAQETISGLETKTKKQDIELQKLQQVKEKAASFKLFLNGLGNDLEQLRNQQDRLIVSQCQYRDDLAAGSNELQAKLENTRQELGTITRAHQETQTQMAQTTKDLRRLIADQESQLKAAVMREDSLKKQLEAAMAKNEDLKQAAKAAGCTEDDLRAQVATLEIAIKAIEKAAEQPPESPRLSKIEASFATITSKFIVKPEDLEALQEEISGRIKGVSSLLEQLLCSDKPYDEILTDFESRLKDQMATLRAEIQNQTELQATIRELQTESERIKLKLSQEEKTVEDHQGELTRLIQDKGSLETRVKTADAKLDTARHDRDEAQAELVRLNQEKGALQSRFDTMVTELDAARRHGDEDHRAELARLNQEKEALEARLETKSGDLERIKQERERLETKVTELSDVVGEFDTLKAEAAHLREDLTEKGVEAQIISANLTMALEQKGKLEADVTRLEDDLRRQEDRFTTAQHDALALLQTELAEARERVAKCQQEQTSSEAQYLGRVKQLNETIEDLTACNIIMEERHWQDISKEISRAEAIESARAGLETELRRASDEFQKKKRAQEKEKEIAIEATRAQRDIEFQKAVEVAQAKSSESAAAHEEELKRVRSEHQDSRAALEQRALKAESAVKDLSSRLSSLESEVLVKSRERTALEHRALRAEAEMTRLAAQITSINSLSQPNFAQVLGRVEEELGLPSHVRNNECTQKLAPLPVSQTASPIMPPPPSSSKNSRRKVDRSAPLSSVVSVASPGSATPQTSYQPQMVVSTVDESQVAFEEDETQDMLNADLGDLEYLDISGVSLKEPKRSQKVNVARSFADFNNELAEDPIETQLTEQVSSPLTDIADLPEVQDLEELHAWALRDLAPGLQTPLAQRHIGEAADSENCNLHGGLDKVQAQANTASKMVPAVLSRGRDDRRGPSSGRQAVPPLPKFSTQSPHPLAGVSDDCSSSPDYIHREQQGGVKLKQYHTDSRLVSSAVLVETHGIAHAQEDIGGHNEYSVEQSSECSASAARPTSKRGRLSEVADDAETAQAKRIKPFHDFGKRPGIPGTASQKLYVDSARPAASAPSASTGGPASRFRSSQSSVPGSSSATATRKRSQNKSDRYSLRFQQEV